MAVTQNVLRTAAQVVCVEARDRYGNLAAVPQACLRAQATGPQGAVPFSPLELLPGETGSRHPQQQRRLGATFTVAGSYGLAVCVVDPDTQVHFLAPLCPITLHAPACSMHARCHILSAVMEHVASCVKAPLLCDAHLQHGSA